MTLYELLFGNKDIPMTNDVSFDDEAKTLIAGTAFILGLSAVLTAKLIIDSKQVKRSRSPRRK